MADKIEGSGEASPGLLSILDRTSGTPWSEAKYKDERPAVLQAPPVIDRVRCGYGK